MRHPQVIILSKFLNQLLLFVNYNWFELRLIFQSLVATATKDINDELLYPQGTQRHQVGCVTRRVLSCSYCDSWIPNWGKFQSYRKIIFLSRKMKGRPQLWEGWDLGLIEGYPEVDEEGSGSWLEVISAEGEWYQGIRPRSGFSEPSVKPSEPSLSRRGEVRKGAARWCCLGGWRVKGVGSIGSPTSKVQWHFSLWNFPSLPGPTFWWELP